MNVKKYDVRVRESRIPYLVAVGKTRITDEDMHQSSKRIADVIGTVYHADRLPEEHMFLLSFITIRVETQAHQMQILK
ncbi:hypothetical protein DXB18_07945 [Clostridium sp. OM02-18AC]|uniref:hypothetical protein n=1 Tax=Clostridium sp. OM02-18AC TaxID=2292311 RepID=UPI000E54CECD|nr:hypothetical protein [Clostridium sp. OM02-18AC]RHV66233.1 hypothetical protein DXB18_07945 [Clostridium sp. OM02-18AC]